MQIEREWETWRKSGSWRWQCSTRWRGSLRGTPLSRPPRGASAPASSLSTSSQPSGCILLLVQWSSSLCFFQRAEHTAPEGGSQLPKELDQVDRVPSVVWRAHQRAQLGQLHRLGKGRRASCPFIFFILQAPFYHLLCIFYNHWDISCLPFRLKNSLNYRQKDLPIDRQPKWPLRCFEDKKVPWDLFPSFKCSSRLNIIETILCRQFIWMESIYSCLKQKED